MLRRTFLGLALALALALAPTTAPADDLADLNEAFGAVINPLMKARAHFDTCRAAFPDREGALRDGFSAWYHRHDMAEAERAIATLAAVDPAIQAQMDEGEALVRQAIEAEVTADPSGCDDFAGVLADSYDPGRALQRLKRSLRRFGLDLPPAPPSPHPLMAENEVLPLALLSARIETVMSTVGSHEGSADSRDLREARGAEAEAWLRAHPVLMVSGRVIDDDEIRDWRGDQQSRFTLRCRSFETDAFEAHFAQMMGEEAVLTGGVRSVTANATGGVITLDRCSTEALGDARGPVATGDDSAGLMLRPPTAEEIYAGPGQGIATKDLTHILYEADFDFRIDGFGNSYTDRNEAIWLLLDDGSAYRHGWSFPFTDLNVDVSKAREPDRWLQWEESGEGFVLTGADGTTQDLTGAQALVSPEADFRPEARYYYLNIGMGGARSDRSYTFTAEGSVTYRRGAFVAGNVGTGYLITSGTADEPVTSTYRFEDFALILQTPEGEIRHFVARPTSSDATRPDTLLIGGTAYWLEKDE
ncbi:hypothetical protein [Gemmobacter sp. 24YEA27]|uniref:hypothetical protein n=1 Tax=Gemmobacter sp. 24YEA27 TaxID=3040672 RepID=UPI0024B38F4E|nr:hypothetical protein [Gemmobacter sp. 24YEA27]